MIRSLACSVLVLIAIGFIDNSSAQRRQMGGLGITVFTDRNFNGRSATYREDVPDLEPLGLNDRISSLRVARGERWEICEHSNYQGRCVVVSGNEPDLRQNAWNDLISSLRRVDGGAPRPPEPPSGNPYIVFFDRPNYRGTPRTYDGPNPSIPNSGQSVTIGRGVWTLCEGQNYSGRCITLDQSVPDLAAYNMRNRVFSVRPGDSGGSAPPPPTSDWYVVIFDRTNYRGTPSNYTCPETDVFKPARSVTIGRGTWQFCQGRNFTGRCVTLNRSVPDLRSYNIRQVGSLRPISRQPR